MTWDLVTAGYSGYSPLKGAWMSDAEMMTTDVLAGSRTKQFCGPAIRVSSALPEEQGAQLTPSVVPKVA